MRSGAAVSGHRVGASAQARPAGREAALAPAEALERISPDLLPLLRQRLAASGYGPRTMAEAESVAPRQLDAVRLPLVQWTLERRGDPAAALALLFAYAGALPEARVVELLGAEVTRALRDAEVLAAGGPGGALRSRYRLAPLEDLWLLSDDPGAGRDAVMGPGPTSLHLAAFMPRPVPGSLLDVGCGAGTFALLAARHGAARAVGTDLNERAVALSRFNALLNGCEAEFRAGDLAAPVRGERFDRVLSQPPYVVQPPGSEAVTYLHGGPAGEDVALRLAGELPDLLAPGGLGLMLVDAPVRAGEELHERYRRAVGEAAVDVVVLAAPGAPADLQALGYAALEAGGFGPGYAEAARRHRAHLESQGLSEFRHALVAVRARARGRGLSVTLPVKSLHGAGHASLDRLLAALDLAERDDASLLRAAVRASPHARWIEERSNPDPSLVPRYRVEFGAETLAVDQEFSEASAIVLRLLDTEPSVGEAVARYAQLCGTAPEEVRGLVLGYVRRGLAMGLLESRG